jgi:hypothetical protein
MSRLQRIIPSPAASTPGWRFTKNQHDGHRSRRAAVRPIVWRVIMERFARLLPFRQFGRLRHLRTLIACGMPRAEVTPDLFSDDMPMPALPSRQPAFARVSLNSAVHAEPEERAPVRIYRGQSRVILVGKIDEVSRMIDRCIAEESAGLAGGILA